MSQEVVSPGYWVNVLNGETAVDASIPSGATDGIRNPNNRKGKIVVARIRHVATGARTCTARIWGYVPGEVDSAGDAVASTAGWVDTEEDFTMTSTAVNSSFAKVYEHLTIFERLDFQITAISGTGNTVGLAFGFTEED